MDKEEGDSAAAEAMYIDYRKLGTDHMRPTHQHTPVMRNV
jgi:hypothetical protein